MVYVALVIFGLVLGSFVNALVWRLHEKERLNRSKSKQAQTKRVKLSILHGRSMCPNCEHELAAKDLVPVFSWLWLRGRCRYCHEPISRQYPLVELLTAALFAGSYYFWPLSLSNTGLLQFIFWLLFLVGFVSLAIYDIRWQLLPNVIIYPLALLALSLAVIVSIWHDNPAPFYEALWGGLVLSGLFYILFQISSGKWIGGGDVKLGVLLGLVVGGPLMSLLLLFLASVSGTFYAIPLIVRGQAKRNARIPFGPFLIVGAIITKLFGASMIAWYRHRLS